MPFTVIDRSNEGVAYGPFATLSEARDCVRRRRLETYDIIDADGVIVESEPPVPPFPRFTRNI